MGIVDTFGSRFRPDLDYMTPAERTLFKKLREGGGVSFFRTAVCAGEWEDPDDKEKTVRCGAEIPKDKKYCSKQCKQKTEGGDDVGDEVGHRSEWGDW